MKRLIFTIAFLSVTALAFGQADTTKKADTAKNGDFSIHIGRKSWDEDSHYRHNNGRYPKGFIGLTFARFDLGLTKMVDHGSLTLQPQNQFLNYNAWKTSNVGFDVFQMGIRFS